MTAPSYLEFESRKKRFYADSSGISLGDTRLSVDEAAHWILYTYVVNSRTSSTSTANFTIVGRDGKDKIEIGFKADKRPQWFIDRFNQLFTYATENISPRIALRMVQDVLEGKTVGTLGYGRHISISKDGLTRREGIFKKRDVTYPWSDYQGCSGYDEIHWRAGEKAVTFKPKKDHYADHGALPRAVDALGKQLG